jgi:hypothetical protein
MGDLNNSSDFTNYLVSIDYIQLTANNGAVYTPLATPVQVDLANLDTTTELVMAPAIPSGTYTSASVTLDYSNTSQVWLNQDGDTSVGTPVNASGTALSTVGVTVTFDPAHPLVITQGQSVRLQIDIDLTASNEVTTTASPATVQVQPFVVLSAAPVDATPMRLRGQFVTTQDVSSGFYLNSRPFNSQYGATGAVIVNTNAQTYFNINGSVYTGAAGLPAMAQQQQGLPMAVYGTLDSVSGITPAFNATEVYFGESQESPLAYYFTGTVTARSGNTITLRGADYVTPLSTVLYVDSVPVTLDSSTVVFQDGIATPGLTIADVSVGQHITVSGQPTLSTSGIPTTVDATGGLVRLHTTTLWGLQNTDATLDLASLGFFAPGAMSFAGTGSGGHDAMPGAYVTDTSAVPPGPVITAGELLQMQGSVTRFGTAPPDFTARALTPGPSTQQTLVVDWVNGGSTKPFTSVSSSGLIVNLADADLGSIHVIRTGPAKLDLKSLPASPLITTTGADQNNLRLAVGSTTPATGISVFNSVEGFVNGVNSAFNGTNKIFRLVAYGQYNQANNTFVASRINVALHE